MSKGIETRNKFIEQLLAENDPIVAFFKTTRLKSNWKTEEDIFKPEPSEAYWKEMEDHFEEVDYPL